MTMGRLVLLILIALAVAAFVAFDLGRFFSLDDFKSQQAAIEAFRLEAPLLAAGVYFAIYVVIRSPGCRWPGFYWWSASSACSLAPAST
jgi:hypothetical protein